MKTEVFRFCIVVSHSVYPVIPDFLKYYFVQKGSDMKKYNPKALLTSSCWIGKRENPSTVAASWRKAGRKVFAVCCLNMLSSVL